MPRYTGKDCATDSWRLCSRKGRCRQTTARTWSTSSPKPAEYSRRENKSVNSIFIFLSSSTNCWRMWVDISMNVDWTVMRDRRSRIRWPSSLTHLPNQHLLFPVPRVRVANEMLLLVKLPMMVRPSGLEVGLRVAKIGWKTDQLMMSPEHDCPKCLMGMMTTTGYWNRPWELEHTLMLYIGFSFLQCALLPRRLIKQIPQ